ncbi:hypothetical protein V2I01_34395 [Micromonospora sp. BRA006-A]|nr:hypothetical protein [Micromonospora sp. BRA006-A]
MAQRVAGRPGKTYWEKVAKDFSAAHPTVKIEIEAIETNQLQRTWLPPRC